METIIERKNSKIQWDPHVKNLWNYIESLNKEYQWIEDEIQKITQEQEEIKSKKEEFIQSKKTLEKALTNIWKNNALFQVAIKGINENIQTITQQEQETIKQIQENEKKLEELKKTKAEKGQEKTKWFKILKSYEDFAYTLAENKTNINEFLNIAWITNNTTEQVAKTLTAPKEENQKPVKVKTVNTQKEENSDNEQNNEHWKDNTPKQQEPTQEKTIKQDTSPEDNTEKGSTNVTENTPETPENPWNIKKTEVEEQKKITQQQNTWEIGTEEVEEQEREKREKQLNELLAKYQDDINKKRKEEGEKIKDIIEHEDDYENLQKTIRKETLFSKRFKNKKEREEEKKNRWKEKENQWESLFWENIINYIQYMKDDERNFIYHEIEDHIQKKYFSINPKNQIQIRWWITLSENDTIEKRINYMMNERPTLNRKRAIQTLEKEIYETTWLGHKMQKDWMKIIENAYSNNFRERWNPKRLFDRYQYDNITTENAEWERRGKHLLNHTNILSRKDKKDLMELPEEQYRIIAKELTQYIKTEIENGNYNLLRDDTENEKFTYRDTLKLDRFRNSIKD